MTLVTGNTEARLATAVWSGSSCKGEELLRWSFAVLPCEVLTSSLAMLLSNTGQRCIEREGGRERDWTVSAQLRTSQLMRTEGGPW